MIEKLDKEIFTELFEKLFEEDRYFILFGAGEIGTRALLRLEYLGLKRKLLCFSDNNESKIGTTIEGIPVFSKKEAHEKYPDASVIITVGNCEAAAAIEKDLYEIGFHNFLPRQVLLHRFEFDGHKEKALVCVDGKYILRQVVVSITERCSLKCKNCGQLMPRFEKPENLDVSEVVESVRRLTDMVDYIQDVSILGGEPLMHPQLTEICRGIGELAVTGKIKFVSMVSNATIIPKPELLAVMKKYGIKIMLSDYGPISSKMKEIQKVCDAAGVEWRYAYVGGMNEEKITYWHELGDLQKMNLTKEQLDSKFSNCNSTYDCNTIYRGRYYFCNFAAFMEGLGYIETSDDSFHLLRNDIPEDELRDRWREFMMAEKTIVACDHCDMHGKVPAAEQL